MLTIILQVLFAPSFSQSWIAVPCMQLEKMHSFPCRSARLLELPLSNNTLFHQHIYSFLLCQAVNFQRTCCRYFWLLTSTSSLLGPIWFSVYTNELHTGT